MTEPKPTYHVGTIVVKRKPTDLELEFAAQLVEAGLYGFEINYRFHPVNRMEFDIAFVKQMVAAEIQGGTWNRGKHGRGAGIPQNAIKLAEAQLLGWQLFFVTTDMVKDGTGINYLKMALRAKEKIGCLTIYRTDAGVRLLRSTVSWA